jgi:hypothetical protein
MSWYQGDIETDERGNRHGTFVGRFNIETFVVAPGVAQAPTEFPGSLFPDTSQNPITEPLQMYHLGLWFNSPSDAQKAGCPSAVTRFNGEHNIWGFALSHVALGQRLGGTLCGAIKLGF